MNDLWISSLSLQEKIRWKLLTLAFKILDFLVPFYFSSLFIALLLLITILQTPWQFVDPWASVCYSTNILPSFWDLIPHHIFLEISLPSLILDIAFTRVYSTNTTSSILPKDHLQDCISAYIILCFDFIYISSFPQDSELPEHENLVLLLLYFHHSGWSLAYGRSLVNTQMNVWMSEYK